MTIKDWPVEDRPREKLLSIGASALSDAELLAIFFRTGTRGQSAVSLARSVLQNFGGLKALMRASKQEFCQIKGLSEGRYAHLQAVLEMSRRHMKSGVRDQGALNSPQLTRAYVCSELQDDLHEVFACLFLDNKHQLISFKRLFNGTIDGASVYPREVVRQCLGQNAAAVIFAHNHPSGHPEPSTADLNITRKLTDALSLIDVRVLDHIVVGDGCSVSFAERGLI